MKALAFSILAVCLPTSLFSAEVTIESSAQVNHEVWESQGAAVIFTCDQIGYVFYLAAFDATSGTPTYRQTTDGGTTWGPAVAITSRTDIEDLGGIWYDRWTPGDTTGTKIHISYYSGVADDTTYYRSLDTADNSLGSEVLVADMTNINQDDGHTSITKATDGDLFIYAASTGVQDVWRSIDNGSSWVSTSASFLDDDLDQGNLMPLSGGDVLLTWYDATAATTFSRVLTNGLVWDVASTTVATNINFTSHTWASTWGTSIDKTSGDIFLAVNDCPADPVGCLPTPDSSIETYFYDESLRSWSQRTNVLSADTSNVRDVKVSIDENTGDIYVVYQRGGTGSHVYYKRSVDGMTSWGVETQVSTTGDDLRVIRPNLMSDERLYAVWFNDDLSDILGDTIVDLTSSTPSLTLTDQTATQVGDALTTSSPVTDVVFYRFNLARSGTVTVNNIRVNFTTGGGIVNADVTNGQLYRDENNDGAWDVGDTLLLGGVTPAGGVLAFNGLGEDPAGGTNYLVRATIDNLVNGDTTTFSVNFADIDVVEAGVNECGTITDAVHIQDLFLTLANHGSGQVPDRFTAVTPVTDVLFRFNLTATGTITVDVLRVNFTTGGGVVNGDVPVGQLWEDVNNDGAIDGGDSQIGGNVTPTGGVLTFNTDFSPAVSGTNYLVRATVANLLGADTTTFSVGAADIDPLEPSVTESGSITNAVHTQDNVVDLTQGHYRWRNDDGVELGDTNEVSETASTTTTNAAYEALSGMSITPGAGDYLVWFSGTLRNSSTGTQHVSLYLDAGQIAESEREITTETSIPNTRYVTATHAFIAGVTAGQTINVRWKTSAGTATMLERTLTVTKVNAADVTQATATTLATETSVTDTLINSMTLTPGAGDYLIWFSGSNANTAAPSKNHVSLYVNGSQVTHTEREIDQEESLGNTFFPVASHARVLAVGATDAIEARWRVSAGTANMNARTLTVYKINPAENFQASSDIDDGPFSTASYTQVNSMTLTPGAGDYLVWFSSSLVADNSGDTVHVSLFSGGSQVPHSEREIWVEGSIDTAPFQSFPVATHAYITGVGGSDAIEVRWQLTGGGTATMHERTLVVQKVPSPILATFAAAEDTKLTGLAKNTIKRVRFEVSNEGNASSGAVTYQLQVAETATCSAGSYNNVPTDTSGHWQVTDSSFITDGEPTANISPGLTDDATTFVSGELKDLGNTTGTITLGVDQFTEVEFSVQALAAATDGGDYCFRLQVLDTYINYAEVQLAAPTTDVTVTVSGTQTATMGIPSTNQYVGGKFVIVDNTGSRNITGITITESGTVDALNNLDNIKLFYELDTTAPYDGASESYAGTESQFGVTDTTGFSAANGTSSFTGTVAINTTSTMVVYVVFDVGAGATPGETVEISINDSSTEVTASAGTVGPATPVAIPGTTTLAAPPAGVIFYSVGTDNTALYSDTASAASGTLTLNSAAANNIGVGDEIREGANRYYITGRTSATVFAIQNSAANGGTPGDTNITFALTAITIFRAFNDLDTAPTGSADANHLNTTDLVTGNFQLNWACYNDGPDPSVEVVIQEPWVTGPANYIRVFTPTDSTQVGISQRHTGVAGTGYRIAPSTVAGSGNFNLLQISTDFGHVRIEGIELDGSNVTGGDGVYGIDLGDSDGASSDDIRISHCLIHDITNSSLADASGLDVAGINVFVGRPSDNTKIWNNIIYDVSNVSTNGASDAKGIRMSAPGVTYYVYNNTVYDIRKTGTGGDANGIEDNGVTGVHAKNNYVGLVQHLMGGPQLCFNGTFLSENNNVSSDATAGGAGSQINQSAYASYFVDTTGGSENLHLLNDSNTLWGSFGTDLDSDANLPITDDVDGEARDATQPDIGADEAAPAVVAFYSVGTDNTALYSDTASASAGTLTLNSPAVDKIGVGDEIREGVNRYYITGRNSATEFTIQNSAANGGTPGDANITFASTAITVFRAFNTLTAAEAGSSNASHLNTANLVTGNFQLNWTCYDDAALNDTVVINGYTTGASSYIHIYTPTATNEVGISQRHTGVAGTGFRLVPVTSTPPSLIRVLRIQDEHVRVTGIEIDGSSITNGQELEGVSTSNSLTGASDIRLDKLIVHDIRSEDGGGGDADPIGVHIGGGNVKLSNSIIYDIAQSTAQANADAYGSRTSGVANNVFYHNNTIFNIKNTGNTRSAWGIQRSVGTVTAKNNAVLDVESTSGGEACFNGAMTQSNNVSSDATAVGPQNQTSYATYFQNITNGSENLHLRNDSNALWGSFGADLDTDPNLPVTEDVDAEARDVSTPDIGADEFAGAVGAGVIYYSVGTDNTALYSDTASASAGTLTLTSPAVDKIGVGDEIREGANRYYITGRTSATEFTIQNSAANGGTPGDTSITFASTAITIFRAFNGLSATQAGSSDANHLATSNLVTGNFQLNWACYNDGPMSDVLSDWNGVSITGWTTGVSNYIRMFAPVTATEVGTSQRHSGTAGSGFRYVPSTATPQVTFSLVDVQADHFRIEGIEIDGSSVSNGQGVQAIGTFGVTTAGSDLWFDKLLIHSLTNTTDGIVRAISLQDGNLKLSNSIIYGLTSVGTTATNYAIGVELNEAAGTFYIHNNTIYNIKQTAGAGGANAYGIVRWPAAGATTVKNTYVGDVNSILGSEWDFNGITTQSNNVSSDATAAGAGSQVNKAAYATYFQNITAGSENLHLRNDSNTLWGSFGADLDSDPNLPITDDIDGDVRDASTPDIGADEFTGAVGAGVIYYSVGIDNTALYSGNASASSGTLTLSSPAADRIGVGDEIREGANRYYINGRNSATEFTVQNSAANGGTPGDTNINFASTAITIFRAFNDLDTATTGSADANHLNTADLVAGDFQLNWACYNDGPDPSWRPAIEEPWVTGASNYIRLFTPTDPSQVGVSQRHTGTAGTGYRIRPVGSAIGISHFNFVFISTDNGYVRLEGIEIDGSGLTNAENIRGIYINDPAPGTGEDVRISHSLIHDLVNTTIDDSDQSKILALYVDQTNNTKISNNVVYHLLNVSTNAASETTGLDSVVGGTTHYVFNNTFYDIQSTATTQQARGIWDSVGSTLDVQNNYVGLVDSVGGLEACFVGPFANENNNVSSDATAAGTDSQTNQSAYASYFVDTTGGSENLHLINDSNTLWGSFGADLDTDPNLPVTDDVDADARDASTPDIGADEFSNPVIVTFYSVGTDNTALYSDTGSASSGTLTLNSAAVDKIGVGDEIREGANRYYITGRISATQFTIQNSAANGGTPGDTNITFGLTAITIFRAFNTLTAAEAGSLDGSHLGTANLVVSNFQLNWTCYNDTALDDTVFINGYTTGPNNYIHIYTPTTTSEVGTSQRHDGTAGTGFRMVPVTSTPSSLVNFVRIDDDHVRITGIEIDGSSITNAQEITGVSISSSVSPSSDIRLDKLIIHDIQSQDGTGGDADPIGIHIGDGNVRLSNSIIYDIVQTTVNVDAWPRGVRINSGNHYLHNNTIFNIKNTGNALDAYGIASAGTVTVKSTVVLDVVASGGPQACFSGALTQSNNVSSDATAVGPQNQSGPYTNYFVDVSDGTEDLHLLNDSNSLWGSFGADLDSDPNLPITDDIDGGVRDASTPDIGADEFGAAPGSLTLADHGATQVGDQFTIQASVTDVLFRLNLSRSGTVTVDNIRVNFTVAGGVANGDVSNGELYRDVNNNGVFDSGTDTLVLGSVTPVAGVLAFNSLSEDPGAGTNYIVRATVNSLNAGDTTTLSVGTADIDLVQGGVLESGSITNAVHTRDAGAIIYYSVGTDNTALYSDTASASTGVLTLNSAAADNIGVGDEIREGANRYYITGRISATEFTIQDSAANGGTPGDSNINFALTGITIFRAFNTLTLAEANSPDVDHLNTSDLVAGNFQLNWTCYDDLALDDTAIIDGYTTGASNYIHIYTPTATSEVGVSQRHIGVAGTGFRIAPITAAPADPLEIIDIRDDHVRITGIEFDGSGITNGRAIKGIEVDASVAASGDLRFNKLIIHDLQSQDGTGSDADIYGFRLVNGNVRISNSIIYDLEQTTALNNASALGVRTSGGSSHYLHNNTIFNIKNTGTGTGTTFGVSASGGTVTAKNTVVLDVAGLGTVACFDGAITQSNNVSSDATATGAGSQINQLSYATYFVSTIAGSENLHLLNDSNTLWGSFGADLDSDPDLPVTDDIDGAARDASTPDIGADEFGAGGPCIPTINFRSIGIDTNPLANTGTASVALGGTVVTLSVALPSNIGRGDRIWLDTSGVNEERFILVRNSDTQVTLQQPAQNDHSGGVSYSIERAYSGADPIQAWETARQGDLVAQNRREIGVAYNDGVLTNGVDIVGSTTDACHFMWLTVAEGDRHSGVAGTGALIDSSSEGDPLVGEIEIFDPYTVVDWFEVTGVNGNSTNAGVRVSAGATNISLSNLIVHGNQNGVRGSGTGTKSFTIRNSIIYDNVEAGIEGDEAGDTVLVENCTVYKNPSRGVAATDADMTVTNTISVNNAPGPDFSVGVGTLTQTNNISSDGTAAGTGPLTGRTATDNPTPGAGNWVIFRSLTAGVENLHLQTGAENDAIDAGTDLSSFFANDIDNELRPGGAWDIGADELAATLMVTGKYTGDGGAGRQITGLGFQPDVVLIKVDYLAAAADDSAAIMKTATMSGANSKPLHAAQTFRTDLITSLDADGFTVDNTLNVNALNSCGAGSDPCEYHWIAWKAGADMKLGTYTGNGTTQSITGAGFSPDYLVVMAETNLRPVHRNSLTGAWSSRFGPGGFSADAITSLDADGFSLGNSVTEPANHPNESGVTYHYAVWNEVAGQMDVGIYPGDDSDDKDINGVGFQPEFVMVQAYDDSKDGRMKSDTMTIGASDDASMSFRGGLVNNVIQDLTTDGFQIGSDTTINDSSINYFYAAFNAIPNLATAVELVSFTATGLDGEVSLEWETGSELDNLGFHLYRSLSVEGPYEQITASVIPGLGSSPEGAKYAYRDSGLTNGVAYYYKLEDIETTGVTELHGPISATPSSEVVVEGGSEGEEGSTGEDLGDLTSRITYGDPLANELKVRRRGKKWMELELITEGFYAIPQDDGSVLLEVPGFEDFGGPDLPDVPVYRTWQDVLAGRNVKVASVKVGGVAEFASLRPSSSELVVVASGDGTVSTGRRRRKRRQPPHVYYPESWAKLMSVGFQGPAKKALVEMAPLRWDATAERLVLARRVVVRISFKGKDKAELKLGKSHREVGSHANRSVYARIAVTEPGLYGVSYESVFGKRRKAIKTSSLRLSRQGEPVAFFVSPNAKKFKKNSKLYFLSDGAALNPYGHEAVYELEASQQGLQMESLNGSPVGAPTSFYWKTLKREENLLYQAAFEGEEDIWQWDWLFGPMTNGYPFEVTNLSPVAENSKLRVWLHGASDFPEDPDHHVRLYVNGTLLTETWWDGETPHFVETELGPGLLQEGENTLEIEEVGDTEAQYSMVMLDRFEVSYPAQLVAEAGELKGSFSESGVATITSPPGNLFDVTDPEPKRVTGFQAVQEGLSYQAESGHRYLLTSSVKTPEVRRAQPAGLKKAWSRAEYLVIGPREFLAAAEPLLFHRRDEGLISGAIATEDIYDEFGYGEATPESIKDFLSYVYHHWSEPTLRYVLLLGDGTYDTKDYLATGVKSQVPVKILKTQFVWTASDPWYGAINGEDILPDVAVGRLPAASFEEAQRLVAKILEYEREPSAPAQSPDDGAGGAGGGAPAPLSNASRLTGPIVLIADNPDAAGNFVSDAESLSSTVLSGEDVRKIYLTDLGSAGARSAVLQAFDDGASLISYMGHGAIHLWANENLLNIWDVDSLSPQSQQPFLLTMNCLNGYFHFPYFNSLSEELLKAEGKGIIAAFSPTGLSLNGPAHRFHKALLDHVVNQQHERLGDAVLAGQAAYAETGAFPELLSIYHLLGDPALRMRQ